VTYVVQCVRAGGHRDHHHAVPVRVWFFRRGRWVVGIAQHVDGFGVDPVEQPDTARLDIHLASIGVPLPYAGNLYPVGNP
jgi:hypothetical protein